MGEDLLPLYRAPICFQIDKDKDDKDKEKGLSGLL